jgi:predicted Zn-dependent peptidase
MTVTMTLRSLPAALALCLAAVASASPEPAALTTFPNGLRLLVLPRPQEATVRIDTYVSLPGAAIRPGLAHLAEHLMFRSSATMPAGSIIDSLMLNGGDWNAHTSLRQMHLETRCLPSRVGPALAIEADRLGRLAPTAEDLAYERTRVLGEYDLRSEIYPWQALGLRVTALAYGAGDGGDPLLGNPEDIAGLELDDVRAFLGQRLRLDRTVVMVAGPVDTAAVAALAAATLGALAPDAGAEPARPLPALPDSVATWVTAMEGDEDRLVVGFRLPCRTVDELALAHLAETIMSRENGHPSLQFYGDEALLLLRISLARKQDVTDAAAAGKAVERFWDETRRVIFNVRDSYHFNKSRAADVEGLRKDAERPRRRTVWRAQQLAAGSPVSDPAALAAIVDTISHATVAAYFAQHFHRDRAVTAFAAGHEAEDERAEAGRRRRRLRVNPYRDIRRDRGTLDAARIAPLLDEAGRLPMGGIRTAMLPNGLPVVVAPMTGTGDVFIGAARSFPVLFMDGDAADTGRLVAYRWLANAGYSDHGANIPPRGRRPGSNTKVSVQPWSARIDADGRASRLDDVAADMAKRIRIKDLNQYAFRHYADGAGRWAPEIAGLASYRAQMWCWAQLFGDDHPGAWLLRPTAASMQAWSAGGAESLHRRLWGSDNLVLVATGGVTLAKVTQAFAPAVGDLPPPGDGDGPRLPAAAHGAHGTVIDDEGTAVVHVHNLFGGGGPAAAADLSICDVDVLMHIVETRVTAAFDAAGIDSAHADVSTREVGAALVPYVDVTVPVRHAAAVPGLVAQAVGSLATRPIDADEEARARLATLPGLLDDLEDPEATRDLLLRAALFGPVPTDILALHVRRRPVLLAERAPRLFPLDAWAWAAVGDEDAAPVRDLATAAP